ncbi:MAG: ABC transporter permease, partial [Candidatus Eisenbacteria bacterium]|nr:ABC transporter permease [Candidatus Eisenbacteria bacterium]
MDTLLAMVAKDFKLLLRDRMGGFFTFGFPIVMAIFFGTLFSGGSSSGPAGGIKLAVVDEDTTTVSRTFADSLAASPELRVTRMTLAEAENAVKLGRQTAFVRLPSGFGAARGRTFAGGGPEVELGMDPSRRAESGMLQGVLMKRAARDTFMQSNASKRPTGSTGAAGGFEPLRFRSRDIARQVKGPRNAYEISFPQGVMWAVVSCALGFALGLVNERQRGTLIRLRVAPLERWRILGGKALGCFLTILMLASVVLLVGRLGFGVRPASFPLL